jgi:small ligand-binding sensory domain FIST
VAGGTYHQLKVSNSTCIDSPRPDPKGNRILRCRQAKDHIWTEAICNFVIADPPRFQWASGFSEAPDLATAVKAACAAVREGLDDAAPDLAVMFCSVAFAEEYDRFPGLVQKELGAKVALGTTGMGVIGTGKEVEGRPAISIGAGVLPGVAIAPFHVNAAAVENLGPSPKRWAELLKTPADGDVNFLLFSHPFSMHVDELVTDLDQAFPKGRKVGGLASGGRTPDTVAIFLGDKVHFEGAVGAAIWGDLDFDVIVAQGCRPVGPTLKVTKAAGVDIYQIDGEPAYGRLMAVLNSLSEPDRMLARRALFVGVALEGHEKEGQFQYDGGYLIRNIMGADPKAGVVRVGHEFHDGQTIRLQVRDARTAEDELSRMLSEYRASVPGLDHSAAFMFQCNGRGSNLFGEEGHDARVFQKGLGDMPLAGFFCNGEIGPVGEVTYVHGFTSSIGILRPKTSAPR